MIEQIPEPDQPNDNWKSQIYMIGTALGTLIGFLSAYLYTRAAEDDLERKGKPERISTGQLLALSLTALGLMRQIAELGKPASSKKK